MTNRPFISFMTDFGVGSSAPSVCRGVMLDITPDARLIDVTHAIRTRDSLLLVARMGELDTTVGSIERDGDLRVLSRERAGTMEWVPGDNERLEPGDVVTVVGTQIGLAQLAKS